MAVLHRVVACPCTSWGQGSSTQRPDTASCHCELHPATYSGTDCQQLRVKPAKSGVFATKFTKYHWQSIDRRHNGKPAELAIKTKLPKNLNSVACCCELQGPHIIRIFLDISLVMICRAMFSSRTAFNRLMPAQLHSQNIWQNMFNNACVNRYLFYTISQIWLHPFSLVYHSIICTLIIISSITYIVYALHYTVTVFYLLN